MLQFAQFQVGIAIQNQCGLACDLFKRSKTLPSKRGKVRVYAILPWFEMVELELS